EDEALLRQFGVGGREHAGGSGDAVRRARQNDRQVLRHRLWREDEGMEFHPIAHGNHHFTPVERGCGVGSRGGRLGGGRGGGHAERREGAEDERGDAPGPMSHHRGGIWSTVLVYHSRQGMPVRRTRKEGLYWQDP